MIEELRKEIATLLERYEKNGLSVERIIVSHDAETNKKMLRIVYTEDLFKKGGH